METELINPDGTVYKSFALATYNVREAGFEGVFMDVHSFDGFDPLNGGSLKTTELASGVIIGNDTLKRVWNGSIGVPRKQASSNGSQEILLGVDRLNIQFVENKVNDDKWVLLGFSDDGSGNGYISMEQIFSR